VARAKGIKKSEISRQTAYAIEATKIGEYSNCLIANLSKGYQQRVGIAQAIIGNPKVIILDEPTVGLDPQQIVDVRDLICDLGKKHTVILSSHILAEVQTVCQSLLIMAKGNLVAFDTPENLEAMYSESPCIELLVRGSQETLSALLNTLNFICGYSINRSDTADICTLKVEPADDNVRERLFFAFAGAGIPILNMTTQKMDLEQVFLRLTSPAGAAASSAQESTRGWKL